MSKSRFKYKKTLDNQNSSTFLGNDTPVDIRKEEVYSHLSIADLGLFAQTSQQAESETIFLRLLQASIHAAPAFLDANKDTTALAAIAILKKHPELLFRKKKVTDHYGRVIWASPYRIFLGAGDIWALRQIQTEILLLIENGEAQAEAQFKEQFPNCPWPLPENFSEEMLYDDRNKEQIKEIVQQLAIVKQLIDIDPFNNNKPLDATKLAAETLCKLFQSKPGEIICCGLHFPLAIMKEVYNTYNALIHYTHNLLLNHLSFFSLSVIKPALNALSALDGQCCQGGLINLDIEKGPNRCCHSSYQHPLGQPLSLRLVNDKDKRSAAVLVDAYDGEVLFVSSTSGHVDCFNKMGVRGVRSPHVFAYQSTLALWKDYREQKNKLMAAIMQPNPNKSTHRRDEYKPNRCVIV